MLSSGLPRARFFARAADSRTALAAQDIAVGLTALELDGRVTALPGGRWQRVASRAPSRTRA